ncbi:MAG TPA: hypothetical protein PK733_09375 [Clostridiales bacterium]|nr:hypothetical protein [Clostridiales bacterium]
MDIQVIPVRSMTDLKKFIMLPWGIYKGNSNWVPPLIRDMKKNLAPLINPDKREKECELFIAMLEGKPVGRIYAGINRLLNEKKNAQMGYFSLFECIDNIEVAKSLFDTAFSWFKEKGINLVRGPVSTEGADLDESKGLLIDCFDRPPVLMNSYNPEYYIRLFEEYGLEKDYDVFAYYLDPDKIFSKNPSKVLDYAKRKYDFRVDSLNLKNLDKELEDIKYILDLAIPAEWSDLAAPDMDEVRSIAKSYISYVDPDLVAIARTNNNRAIGFAVALPDYNQLLIHLNGRINPISILKYAYYKKRINGARVFIMFVIPEYRKKGVSFAVYHYAFNNGVKKGYTWGEGSTIGEENVNMRNDIESIGGQHYKTYRIFRKELA